MRIIMTIFPLFLTLFPVVSAYSAGELIGGDLSFKGVVVAYPCSIAPESEKVPVDFGEIPTKVLYANRTSTPVSFSIKLQNCNPAVFNSVTVAFHGDSNPNMTDRLAINAVAPGSASGVGIGLLEADDTPIRLDIETTPTPVTTSAIQLNFKAFVEGEPGALSNGTLTTGPFTATAYYTLNYQ
ncbi:TPA: type 1 fimbrial protein [Citrobacter koseri]|nr:type 1 fimbrial protein [Citrobacter koseri]